MDNRKRVTDEEIREQIGRRRGNITAVAQTLRCSRETVYKRLRQSEELRDRLAEAREAALDRAEQFLFEKCEAGDTTALIFFLKTQGRSRGYGGVGRSGQGRGWSQEVMDILKKGANK